LSSLENSKSDLKESRDKHAQLEQNIVSKQEELENAAKKFDNDR